jgi:hypothetical protein
MKKSWSAVFMLLVIGLAFGRIAPANADSGKGTYYPPPSWDMTLPGVTRFLVLMNMFDEGVLDRETGIVWQRSPTLQPQTWSQAHAACIALTSGGRYGWRLPTIQELNSLVEPTNFFNGVPALAAGHPFTNVNAVLAYWSATPAAADNPSAPDSGQSAWSINFATAGFLAPVQKTTPLFVWCVRGGVGVATPSH